MAAAINAAFFDIANDGTNGAPASPFNAATPIPSTGNDEASIDADLAAAIVAFTTAGGNLENAVWGAHPRTLAYLARLRVVASGALAFPLVTARGGTLAGLPVVGITGMPLDGDETTIALFDPTQLWLFDEGAARISVSEQGTVQLVDNPQAGAQQVVSLWQFNLLGYLLERRLAWSAMVNTAQVITEVDY